MTAKRALLAATGYKRVDRDSHGHAFPAMIAIRPIGKGPAAAEAQPHQLPIHPAVDQMARGGNLRARQPVGQVAAGIRRRCVKLQGSQRQVVKLGQGAFGADATARHASVVAVEFTNRDNAAANSRRRIGRAPSRARWEVCCWQSIRGTSCRRRMSTKCANATLEASVTRANMDSPKNILPTATPYRPPASSP